MRNKALTMAVLLICGALGARCAIAASTTITIGGSEQQVGSTWDTSAITISFNSFTETVTYGQYSSPSSIASAFAAMFTRDYNCDGLSAQASGSTITFNLKNATFGPITVDDPNSSFTVSTSGWQGGGGPPAPPAPPTLNGCQVGMLDPGIKPQMTIAEVLFPWGVGQTGSGGNAPWASGLVRFRNPNEVLLGFLTGR